MRETPDERKKENVFLERFFLNKKTEDFFGNYKRDKTNKRSLCSQKMLGLNRREWKKKKKGRSFLENFAKENGKMSSTICCIKKQLFFSARHNRKAKNVKIGETIFQVFVAKIVFKKKSNNEERKHNEKTHKERTKQEEEVKRKSKENQLLFRGVFFNRNKGIKKIFSKRV